MDQRKILKTVFVTATLLLLLPLSNLNAKLIPKKPNIIFILADDQGWNGTSVQMHPDMPDSKSDYFQTPNLEKLAKAGLRFSDAYAPGPMCSPTRASLQTGKSPAQLRMTNVGRARPATTSQKLILQPHTSTLSPDETTIGEILQGAGYATALFGKWHLGGDDGPGGHGYDAHDGPTGNANGNVNDPNPKDIFGITERGMSFMEKHTKAGKPFYLQLWHYAVHGPVLYLKETEEACAARAPGNLHTNSAYAAMTEDLDTGVGMIMQKIEDLGIADNTYVIYMSDHGAPPNLSTNAPLAQGKGTLWEGGLRVPLIISGPGVMAGSFCGVRTVGWDLFPTFCELAGVKETMPKGLEGASLKPLFATGKGKVKRHRKEIVFHYPHFGQGGSEYKSPHSTIMLNDYKLIKYYENNEFHLFDLKEDIGEKNNLSKELADKTEIMHRRLNDYLKDIHAGLPSPNPEYDPKASAQGGTRGRRGTGPSPREELQKELLALEEAYKQKDTEKIGHLIVQMKQRLANMPARTGRPASGQGRGGQNRGPSPQEERQKEMLALEEAHKQNDTEKIGQLIAEIKERLANMPARPGGRGAGRRGPRSGGARPARPAGNGQAGQSP